MEFLGLHLQNTTIPYLVYNSYPYYAVHLRKPQYNSYTYGTRSIQLQLWLVFVVKFRPDISIWSRFHNKDKPGIEIIFRGGTRTLYIAIIIM